MENLCLSLFRQKVYKSYQNKQTFIQLLRKKNVLYISKSGNRNAKNNSFVQYYRKFVKT